MFNLKDLYKKISIVANYNYTRVKSSNFLIKKYSKKKVLLINQECLNLLHIHRQSLWFSSIWCNTNISINKKIQWKTW